MMPVLVGKDVGLCERATLGAERRAELVEEPEVDIDILVVRAVEGTAGRRGNAAAGADLVGEEARPGQDVLLPRGSELVGPVGLDAVDVADDPAILNGVRVGPRLALGRQGAAGRPRLLGATADRLAAEAADRLAGLRLPPRSTHTMAMTMTITRMIPMPLPLFISTSRSVMITPAHLTEFPDYYTRLAVLEREAEEHLRSLGWKAPHDACSRPGSKALQEDAAVWPVCMPPRRCRSTLGLARGADHRNPDRPPTGTPERWGP